MAESLGFKVGKELSLLGKAAASAWRKEYGTEPQQSKRECGGAMRKLNLYPSNDPIVLQAIKAFYARRLA